jgi:GT2 family glycosyltransferase
LNYIDKGIAEAFRVREKIDEVTFVIPTNRDTLRTPDSIPPEYKVTVERDYECSENKTRNRGIRKAETGFVALCDDDIAFDSDFLKKCLSLRRERVIVGLADYHPLRWVISRFMLFAKSDWEEVGGFDESVRHGADTDFCIRAEKLGIRTIRVPRDSVQHIEHEKPYFHRQHIRWLWYLWRRHPRQITVPAFKLVFSKMTGITI